VYAECETLLSPQASESLAVEAAAFPAVRLAVHYDGPEAHRTASGALSAMQQIKRSSKTAAAVKKLEPT
jgi:hypothetical protein